MQPHMLASSFLVGKGENSGNTCFFACPFKFTAYSRCPIFFVDEDLIFRTLDKSHSIGFKMSRLNTVQEKRGRVCVRQKLCLRRSYAKKKEKEKRAYHHKEPPLSVTTTGGECSPPAAELWFWLRRRHGGMDAYAVAETQKLDGDNYTHTKGNGRKQLMR